jgi:hypothetical protein
VKRKSDSVLSVAEFTKLCEDIEKVSLSKNKQVMKIGAQAIDQMFYQAKKFMPDSNEISQIERRELRNKLVAFIKDEISWLIKLQVHDTENNESSDLSFVLR